MCDYSLQTVRSRPAKVGDKLTTRDFGTCTRGFAAAEDAAVAVCVLPGTELAFSGPVTVTDFRFVVNWRVETLGHATAIFRQVNRNEPMKHHDALEFPDGRIVLLTRLISFGSMFVNLHGLGCTVVTGRCWYGSRGSGCVYREPYPR